jgi:parallel beta-helix repeat protein
VNINNTTISGNTAAFGGGINSDVSSFINLSQSAVSGNSATYNGGGMSVFNGSVGLSNSTVSGNSALIGGALAAYSSSVGIINSTLSNNTAMNHGGGIYATLSEDMRLTNSLVAGNRAPSNAEVSNDFSTFTMHYNLFGDSSNSSADAFSADLIFDATNITATSDGTQATEISSILAPLSSSRGATKTHSLVSASPAIDAADNAVCAASPINNVDQQGASRPVGNACDIGSFEGDVGDDIYVVPLPNGKVVIFSL